MHVLAQPHDRRPDPVLDSPLGGLAREQHGLLTRRQCLAHGLTDGVVARRIARGHWARPARGLVDTGLVADRSPDGVARRGVVLSLLSQGPGAVAVGPSALLLHGVWGVPHPLTPQAAQVRATKREPPRGARSRRFRTAGRVVEVGGLLAVDPVLALAQTVVEAGPTSALGLLDSALHRRILQPEELDDVRSLARGRRGVRSIAQVWPLIDARRESPLESWAYYDLWSAGLCPTDVQITIGDAHGQVLARCDMGYLLDDGTWLMVELDGRDFHTGAVALTHDYARGNDLSLAGGMRVIRFVAEQLGWDGPMVRTIRQHLRTRSWAPPRPRTLDLASRIPPNAPELPEFGENPAV
ncbi:type IV toxin-antitoxin system AbiEi family antitoxin domain-containing protein [Propionicicella superfundia]|uniref:type IV toxin-antitoxin system AbiEi family antitoxin domain-containing protein n=1 Tax=Propionicicella superfundia TaxID=348582 RepID=UPI00041C5190|nr:type IV toxin-antitoxin system AbiEi family antitoxin domain-containing protein [Propionicicella superfundia]